MSTLKERVESLMTDPKLGVSDVASIAGVKPPSVSDWLNGKTKTLKTGPAIRLSKHFKINLLWLTEGVGPKINRDAVGSPPKDIAGEPDSPYIVKNLPAPKNKRDLALEEIATIASHLDDAGLARLIGMATVLAEKYPLSVTKQTQKSS